MLGQRLTPRSWHRVAALLSDERLRQSLDDLRARIVPAVRELPTHQQFLDGHFA